MCEIRSAVAISKMHLKFCGTGRGGGTSSGVCLTVSAAPIRCIAWLVQAYHQMIQWHKIGSHLQEGVLLVIRIRGVTCQAMSGILCSMFILVCCEHQESELLKMPKG